MIFLMKKQKLRRRNGPKRLRTQAVSRNLTRENAESQDDLLTNRKIFSLFFFKFFTRICFSSSGKRSKETKRMRYRYIFIKGKK